MTVFDVLFGRAYDTFQMEESIQSDVQDFSLYKDPSFRVWKINALCEEMKM